MRSSGPVTEVLEVTPTDHLCWVYDDAPRVDAAFDAAVRAFLAGGLSRGERLLCVGERIIDSLRADAAPLSGIEELRTGGALETLTLEEAYAATGRFSAERQLQFYDAATRRALADGYRGLRVVADVSPLAADEDRRSDLLRWEHLADDFVASRSGMTAMCAYRSDVGSEALTDAASAHPLVHAPDGLPPFQLFFADERIELVGSVDTFSAERLSRMLATSPVAGPAVTLDMTGTEFVDVAGCRALARWARDLHAGSGVLRISGASSLVPRMWQLLGLSELAPVDFVAASR